MNQILVLYFQEISTSFKEMTIPNHSIDIIFLSKWNKTCKNMAQLNHDFDFFLVLEHRDEFFDHFMILNNGRRRDFLDWKVGNGPTSVLAQLGITFIQKIIQFIKNLILG